MSKKKLQSSGGLVYSTNPDLDLTEKGIPEADTLPAKEQRLKVRLDTRHRAGKAVTLIEGFRGKHADLQELGRQLRSFCGTGGSVKDGEIIVQGDNRQKIMPWLLKNGFTAAKSI